MIIRRQSHREISELPNYSYLMHSDWLKLITLFELLYSDWLKLITLFEATSQNSLFQRRVVTLL